MSKVFITAPPRTRPTRVAVHPSAARSRWIEAFYIAEAKAQLDHQQPRNHRRAR